MKTFYLICVAALLGLSSSCNAQTWSLSYGKEEDKLAFYNSKSDPNFAEDAPYGPMSFRVVGKNLWVLDSVRGKLRCFNESGKQIKIISIPGLTGTTLLEDFAFSINNSSKKIESIWIANADDFLVRKISVTNGNVLAKVGGNKNQPGGIIQVQQIEVDSEGKLYVADIARGTLTIFSPTGIFLKEYPWQSSGFVIDKTDNLHLLHYSDNSGYFHRVYSPKGQLIRDQHLGFINNTNARIIDVDDNGSIILSMNPKEGFQGKQLLYKINKYGVIIEQSEFTPPFIMNREIFVNGNNMFLAEANFETAPNSKFIIKPLTWSRKVTSKE